MSDQFPKPKKKIDWQKLYHDKDEQPYDPDVWLGRWMESEMTEEEIRRERRKR